MSMKLSIESPSLFLRRPLLIKSKNGQEKKKILICTTLELRMKIELWASKGFKLL